MENRSSGLLRFLITIILAVSAAIISGCTRSKTAGNSPIWNLSKETTPTATTSTLTTVDPGWNPLNKRLPGAPIFTPTPDPPHPLPPIRTDPDTYAVKSGDTLGEIANRFGVSVETITEANKLADPNILDIGQVLLIPVPTPQAVGLDFKIIPDSELVYSPSSVGFDIEQFIQSQGGFLASYWEQVNDVSMSGAEIVQSIAQDYSVNPRLLLAALEYQSNWLTASNPEKTSRDYPMELPDENRKGLYRQLAWAANTLSRGYYLWRVNGVATWLLSDGGIVPIAPTINAGTAGVQQLFALLYDRPGWEQAISEHGLFNTYNSMFGYPFDYAIEPLLPPYLIQPVLQLPFEIGVEWAFTSGPHGGWGDGSAWAALDFAPPGEAPGCIQSDAWVTAVAGGLILRSENGIVVQDLDNDGLEQTGWVITYLHIETRQRVTAGTILSAGEHIGHPSCEGGITTGTHVHLARRFNGEWIPADQNIPFVLDGWISIGTGVAYEGFMERNDQRIEAYAGRSPSNGIQR